MTQVRSNKKPQTSRTTRSSTARIRLVESNDNASVPVSNGDQVDGLTGTRTLQVTPVAQALATVRYP